MLSALKNFAVTLLIAAVVFGVVAYFATQFVTATVSDILGSEMSNLDDIISGEENFGEETESGAESAENSEEVILPEIKGNSFTFLVVCSGYRPEIFVDYLPTTEDLRDRVNGFKTASDSFGILAKDYREIQATSIVLVRADKERREYTYTYLSPETRVHTSTGYLTLGEVYYLHGYEAIGEYVRGLTGIEVDYTFLLEGYNMEEFIYNFGEVPVYNPKNIYAEGQYHTIRSEITREYINEDGEEIVDHYNNSMVLSAGDISFTEYTSHILNTLKERSSAEIEMKGTYSVAIVEAYVKKLGALSLDDFALKLEKALAVPENPDPESKEPADGILQSNFTIEEIPEVYEMIRAAQEFSSSVILYPGTYIPATEEMEAYFEPDLKNAVKRFMQYRFVSAENQ